jgi:hypothetical protein
MGSCFTPVSYSLRAGNAPLKLGQAPSLPGSNQAHSIPSTAMVILTHTLINCHFGRDFIQATAQIKAGINADPFNGRDRSTHTVAGKVTRSVVVAAKIATTADAAITKVADAITVAADATAVVAEAATTDATSVATATAVAAVIA